MPRFARLFEAAADTLNAYYQAVAEVNIDSLMGLWIDEEFASCICADGSHLHGLDSIRAGLQPARNRAGLHRTARYPRYDSLGTVVYAIAEAHQPGRPESDARDGVHHLRDGSRTRRMAHRAYPRESDARRGRRPVRDEDAAWPGTAALTRSAGRFTFCFYAVV